jgi:hypothetical protein
MMAKYSVNIAKEGSKLKVSIGGTIDEDVDFTLYPLAGASEIELHLQEIKSINSCGIREWIKWIGGASGASVDYMECPKIIVDQVNMVQGFLPTKGRVSSFYVPFYNEDSGSEKNVLFKMGSEYDASGGLKIPQIKDESGNPMEMDVVEAKYFKFLKK